MRQCKWCNAEMTGRKRMFCNENCRTKYFARKQQTEMHRLLEEQRKEREAAEAEEAKKRCRKPKKEEEKPQAVLKSLDVCKGCKYLFKGQTELRNTCNYAEATGHSRIMIELEHGGVKADSCCCYEAKRKE